MQFRLSHSIFLRSTPRGNIDKRRELMVAAENTKKRDLLAQLSDTAPPNV